MEEVKFVLSVKPGNTRKRVSSSTWTYQRAFSSTWKNLRTFSSTWTLQTMDLLQHNMSLNLKSSSADYHSNGTA
jgi:hypothetical protein